MSLIPRFRSHRRIAARDVNLVLDVLDSVSGAFPIDPTFSNPSTPVMPASPSSSIVTSVTAGQNITLNQSTGDVIVNRSASPTLLGASIWGVLAVLRTRFYQYLLFPSYDQDPYHFPPSVHIITDPYQELFSLTNFVAGVTGYYLLTFDLELEVNNSTASGPYFPQTFTNVAQISVLINSEVSRVFNLQVVYGGSARVNTGYISHSLPFFLSKGDTLNLTGMQDIQDFYTGSDNATDNVILRGQCEVARL